MPPANRKPCVAPRRTSMQLRRYVARLTGVHSACSKRWRAREGRAEPRHDRTHRSFVAGWSCVTDVRSTQMPRSARMTTSGKLHCGRSVWSERQLWAACPPGLDRLAGSRRGGCRQFEPKVSHAAADANVSLSHPILLTRALLRTRQCCAKCYQDAAANCFNPFDDALFH